MKLGILHLLPAFAATSVPWSDRIIFGPPVFAPLLFVNLALLAGLGLWDLAAKGYGSGPAGAADAAGGAAGEPSAAA